MITLENAGYPIQEFVGFALRGRFQMGSPLLMFEALSIDEMLGSGGRFLAAFYP